MSEHNREIEMLTESIAQGWPANYGAPLDAAKLHGQLILDTLEGEGAFETCGVR